MIADSPVVFIYVTSGLAITVAPLVLISRAFWNFDFFSKKNWNRCLSYHVNH